MHSSSYLSSSSAFLSRRSALRLRFGLSSALSSALSSGRLCTACVPRSLIAVAAFSLILFILVPVSSHLAVYPSSFSSPLSAFHFPLSTFTYSFAHASFLHCAVNVFCLFTLVRVLTIRRCVVAYLCAVIASLIPGVITMPTLGFSAIIFWFYGYIARQLWRTAPSALLGLIPYLLVGFFLPWIAAGLHLCMFAAGFLSWHAELLLVRLRNFLLTSNS